MVSANVVADVIGADGSSLVDVNDSDMRTMALLLLLLLLLVVVAVVNVERCVPNKAVWLVGIHKRCFKLLLVLLLILLLLLLANQKRLLTLTVLRPTQRIRMYVLYVCMYVCTVCMEQQQEKERGEDITTVS
jgi:magnesium-transporting ATPase (P-type)